MPLIRNTYGKGRVRVMRIHREPREDGVEYNEVRELTVLTMLEGDFSAAYTAGDNKLVVATDTIKNITYVVARENMTACPEAYGEKLAAKFLEHYPHVDKATVTALETKWVRNVIGGKPHPHAFLLDSNGMPTTTVTSTRETTTVVSGIKGFTFMKSTGSGWVDFLQDEYTTLPDTTNRMAATSMDATWTWLSAPADYPATNAKILETMLEVFATTYSRGVQDSLYRMGEAALAAVPELATISMACPNKHYLPMSLDKFGMSSDNSIFIPTDEPHGQIECTVGR
jgi:urate oxidase